jgi:hypothetical protein
MVEFTGFYSIRCTAPKNLKDFKDFNLSATQLLLYEIGEWSNKWFRLCDRNSVLFRELILMKISGLNGFVRFVVDQFERNSARANVLSIFGFDAD